MTSAQVVETSVTNNSSFQNYPHPDDHTIRTSNLYVFFTRYRTQELFHILSVVEFIGQTRGVLREVWYKVNMNLNRGATLRQHPVFNSRPESQMILRDFDAPVDAGDHYVQRLTTYLQVYFDLPLIYHF